MSETPTYIRNHEAVLAVVGCWSDFHDSPLLSLEYSSDHSRIDLVVHVFEMTSRVDSRGYLESKNHHLVDFRFSGVADVDLTRLTVPNTLFEMSFSPPRDFDLNARFRVGLDSILGPPYEATFSAASGEVISVLACDQDGNSA
jgi:hypothetical protein